MVANEDSKSKDKTKANDDIERGKFSLCWLAANCPPQSVTDHLLGPFISCYARQSQSSILPLSRLK